VPDVRLSNWGLDKGGAVDDPTPVWGPDAAAQSAAAGAGGAGGVGGLIMGALYADNSYDDESGVCYGYDANGDVMTLVNMGGNSGYYLAPNVPGSLAAYYMYDPFGGLALATGNFAYANPFRFSTKYAEGDFALFNGSIHTCSPDDLDPGLYYCISREYRTDIGRFMSRDPLDEAGGLNLYATCGNDLVNRVDALGLSTFAPDSDLSLELFRHYIGRSGTLFTLSTDDVLSLDTVPDVDVLNHVGVRDKLNQAIETNQNYFEVTESDDAVAGYYTGPDGPNNALGGFLIRVTGTGRQVNNGTACWQFVGDLRIEDNYPGTKAYQPHRSHFGNWKAQALQNTPGVPFQVQSQWLSLTQDLVPERNAVWIGAQ
jgi:RHS repeat-associated protein